MTYTVSGSANDWILDFSVTNNLNQGQVVYFFGVLLPGQAIVGSPAGSVNCASQCTTTTFDPATNVPAGVTDNGPNLTYNDLWLSHGSQSTLDQIPAGSTLSGYEVEDTSVLPPSSVDWFAYAFDSTNGNAPYTGGGNFIYSGDCVDAFGATYTEQEQFNPGFAGVATPTPEPPTSALLLLGLGLLLIGSAGPKSIWPLAEEHPSGRLQPAVRAAAIPEAIRRRRTGRFRRHR